MVWPFKPKTHKQIARIEITGAIASDTRKRVLKALEIVKERQYPALLLRIDSPGEPWEIGRASCRERV